MTRYWLMKSEPTCYSIDDLERMHTTSWDGVRNYQARNIMRDEMHVGDLAFFYHSSCNPAGIVGLCRVSKEAHPDYTAWDPKSDHFDPKASPDKPIWMMVDVEFVEKFPNIITLHELKQHPELADLMVTERGSRLSVQPVSAQHFQFILNLK